CRSSAPVGLSSSLTVLTQNTTPKIAKIGHSKVYAQLRMLPLRARRNCQSPSQIIPTTAATANRCQPIHLGVTSTRQRGSAGLPDMALSLAAGFGRSKRRPRFGQARRVGAGRRHAAGDNRAMPLAELLAGRFGLADRLPSQIDDLRGPVQGVIMLPRHL